MIGRGLLILIEGLDRSGKSTQCQMLAESFDSILQEVFTALERDQKEEQLGSNAAALVMRFPNRTTQIGSILNSYLQGSSSKASSTDNKESSLYISKLSTLRSNHLLFSANRWECLPEIHSTLERGTSIILDRYIYSGIAYSYAAYQALNSEFKKSLIPDGNHNKNFPGWLHTPDLGLPIPDITLFLTVDQKTAQARAGFGAERYETTDIQRFVAKCFTEILAVSHKEHQDKDLCPWIEIPTDGCDQEQVHFKIRQIVKELLFNWEKLNDQMKKIQTYETIL